MKVKHQLFVDDITLMGSTSVEEKKIGRLPSTPFVKTLEKRSTSKNMNFWFPFP
jgi:hypothetical protein